MASLLVALLPGPTRDGKDQNNNASSCLPIERSCGGQHIGSAYCSHMQLPRPTLHELGIKDDVEVSSFSDEQEGHLSYLSPQKLSFDGLWVLHPSLKGYISFLLSRAKYQPLSSNPIAPKNGLPTSLETFSVFICSSALEEEIKRFTKRKKDTTRIDD